MSPAHPKQEQLSQIAKVGQSVANVRVRPIADISAVSAAAVPLSIEHDQS
jgi:hypothetical protein